MKRGPQKQKLARILGATLVTGGALGAFVGADGGGALRGFVLASVADGTVVAVASERAAAPLVRAMGMDAGTHRNTGGTR